MLSTNKHLPAGNDALLLSGLPALMTAAGAYALMLIGITSVLWVKRVMRLKVLSRDTND